MATYEEIKAKYANRAREHRASVALAESKVERIKAIIDHYTEEREAYRGGPISAERAKCFREYSDKITALKTRLHEAEIALATARLGDGGMSALEAGIDRMIAINK